MTAASNHAASAHAALLLAAGGSMRLGRPKALLQRDGEPLVRRVARMLLATQPCELVVIVGSHAEHIAAALADLPMRCVHNRAWESGLASSLQCGAHALAAHPGGTLVATVDQLHLTPQHLIALLAPPDAQRDVVSHYGGILGVPARISAATLQDASGLHGDVGFGRHWRSARPAPIRITSPTLLEDLDTPDDLQRAIAAGWIDPPQ